MANHAHSQDLKDQQWEHRIILIVSNKPNTSLVRDQLNSFSNHSKELLDRKLLVYLVTPYKTIVLDELLEEKLNINSGDLWDKYHSPNHSFKICLLGLDGGTKFTKYSVVTSSEIFNLIDSMPMRRSELRNKE